MGELKNKIEALLFVAGMPIGFEKLAKILKINVNEVKAALEEMAESFKNRGLRIIIHENQVQMVSAPEHAQAVEDLVKSEFREELSPAALETLAIVAYQGPLTRSEIEFIRGVNSVYTLRNLLLRGLVEREGNPEDGRSYIYKISFEFLKQLGLNRIRDLPDYENLSKKYRDWLKETPEIREDKEKETV